MHIAIIPARGASKRIPGKNSKLFCNQPILSYSITAAKKSKLFSRILVSTEDPSIASLARSLGAEVPFVRPLHLADDYTPVSYVIKHAVEWLYNTYKETIDSICCISATAPLLQSQDLQKALALLIGDIQFVFAATEFSYPIHRAFRLTQDKRAQLLYPEHRYTRSQDLEKAYHDAGMFYFGRPQAFVQEIPVLSEAALPYLLPPYRVQDIDTLDDWYRAEKYYQLMIQEKSS